MSTHAASSSRRCRPLDVRASLIVVGVVLALPTAARADDTTAVAVLSVDVFGGTEARGASLRRFIEEEIRANVDLRLVASDAMDAELARSERGSDGPCAHDLACVTAALSKVGAKYGIRSAVAAIGETEQVKLELIDTSRAAIQKEVIEDLGADPEAKVRALVRIFFPPRAIALVVEPPTGRTPGVQASQDGDSLQTAEESSTWYWWVLGAAAVVAAGTAATIALLPERSNDRVLLEL